MEWVVFGAVVLFVTHVVAYDRGWVKGHAAAWDVRDRLDAINRRQAEAVAFSSKVIHVDAGRTRSCD